MNKLRSSIGNQPQTPTAAPTKIPTQRPASPPTQPVIQQREKSSVSDEFVISNESLVRPSAARRAERMVSASPVPRMMTSPDNHQVASPVHHQVASPVHHQVTSPVNHQMTPTNQRDDPSAFLMNPPQQQQQQQRQTSLIEPRYSKDDDDLRSVDERGSFFNQPPVNFPSQNTKNSMDYFELQKLMYPASVPRRKRDVTPTHFRSASGAGTPNNVASEPAKGEVPIYDTYLRHETAKNRKQFGGGGTSEFASANPVTPMNVVTDSRISDNPEKNFKSGGSVPTFVPKNYVAPPNFGNARKMRQGSDSGPAPTYAKTRVKRASSLSGSPAPKTEDAQPPLQQPRRNLARQSKIERNLAKSFEVGGTGRGGSGGGGGGAGGVGNGVRRSASVNVINRKDSDSSSSRGVSMSPAPQRREEQQQRPPQQQVKFNPESHVIYYDDYDTMTEDDDAFTEDEEDYELIFNDPMPNQSSGTYSYSFKHGQEEEEAEERIRNKMASKNRNDDEEEEEDGNKFKTISPPTYGEDGVREVPMDREIKIQRPSSNGGDNRMMRNQEGGAEEEDVEDAASEAASTSPNASPARDIPDVSEIDVTSGEE